MKNSLFRKKNKESLDVIEEKKHSLDIFGLREKKENRKFKKRVAAERKKGMMFEAQ